MGHKRQRDISAQVEIQCSYCQKSPVSGGLKRNWGTRAGEEGNAEPAVWPQFDSLFKTIHSVFSAKLDSGRLIEQTHVLHLSRAFKAHHEWRKHREGRYWASLRGNGVGRETERVLEYARTKWSPVSFSCYYGEGNTVLAVWTFIHICNRIFFYSKP